MLVSNVCMIFLWCSRFSFDLMFSQCSFWLFSSLPFRSSRETLHIGSNLTRNRSVLLLGSYRGLAGFWQQKRIDTIVDSCRYILLILFGLYMNLVGIPQDSIRKVWNPILIVYAYSLHLIGSPPETSRNHRGSLQD